MATAVREYTSEQPFTILIEGLSGSGKSTFARQFIGNDQSTYAILRSMRESSVINGESILVKQLYYSTIYMRRK